MVINMDVCFRRRSKKTPSMKGREVVRGVVCAAGCELESSSLFTIAYFVFGVLVCAVCSWVGSECNRNPLFHCCGITNGPWALEVKAYVWGECDSRRPQVIEKLISRSHTAEAHEFHLRSVVLYTDAFRPAWTQLMFTVRLGPDY